MHVRLRVLQLQLKAALCLDDYSETEEGQKRFLFKLIADESKGFNFIPSKDKLFQPRVEDTLCLSTHTHTSLSLSARMHVYGLLDATLASS